ncbi:MAG: hypothetical protein VXW36_02140, partial [Candidatus Thermoplasmatota archaeon]|nr:hypothetical protein [Candidatus Thermoplasmatota archaeon]
NHFRSALDCCRTVFFVFSTRLKYRRCSVIINRSINRSIYRSLDRLVISIYIVSSFNRSIDWMVR